jgi:hypothetical protein
MYILQILLIRSVGFGKAVMQDMCSFVCTRYIQDRLVHQTWMSAQIVIADMCSQIHCRYGLSCTRYGLSCTRYGLSRQDMGSHAQDMGSRAQDMGSCTQDIHLQDMRYMYLSARYAIRILVCKICDMRTHMYDTCTRAAQDTSSDLPKITLFALMG